MVRESLNRSCHLFCLDVVLDLFSNLLQNTTNYNLTMIKPLVSLERLSGGHIWGGGERE